MGLFDSFIGRGAFVEKVVCMALPAVGDRRFRCMRPVTPAELTLFLGVIFPTPALSHFVIRKSNRSIPVAVPIIISIVMVSMMVPVPPLPPIFIHVMVVAVPVVPIVIGPVLLVTRINVNSESVICFRLSGCQSYQPEHRQS
jgi:hypothetical protein